jgi:hypothetical protein
LTCVVSKSVGRTIRIEPRAANRLKWFVTFPYKSAT